MTKLIKFNELASRGVTRQYIAGIASCLSLATIGNVIYWTSPAILKIKNHETSVELETSEIALMVSILYIGSLASPIPCGYLIDRIGRKLTLLYSALFSLASWVIIYFATEPYHIYVARFLAGITVGANQMIVPVYLAEISEPKYRGSMANLMAIMINFGALFEYVIGPYVSYNILTILSSLIAILFIISFVFIPESPYYYALKNKNDKAMESLLWYRKDKNQDDIIKEMIIIDTSIKQQMKSKRSYKDLISSKNNRKALSMALLLSIFQRLTGVGALMSYSSVTLPENSLPWLNVGQCITILSIVWFSTNIASTAIIDRFKRRNLLICSTTGCSITLFTASVWFYTRDHTDLKFIPDLTWIPFASFMGHAIFYATGIGPIASSYRGELFSANIKGKASAITQISMSIVSFFIGHFYLLLADKFGMFINFLIFSISCFFCIFFVKFYLIETKDKSLQKIQEELNGIDS